MSTRYDLLPAQRELFRVPHELDTDLALYQGGVGSGKTMAGVLLGYAISRLFPGSRGLVGAATHSLLRDTTRLRWQQVVPAGDIARWTQSPDTLVLRNGSEIWFRHLSDPERLASTEFSWIHVEEASQLNQEIFATLLARLRYGDFNAAHPGLRKRFRLFATSNPEEHPGYLYERFIEPEQPQPNVRYIRAPTKQNRFLLAKKPDYCETIRGMVDEAYARIYLDGETGRLLRGAVYRNFNRAEHVGAGVRYDPGLPLHISFDFNVDFMIALIIQKRLDGCVWVVDELVLRDGADTRRLCEEIMGRYGNHATGVVVHGDATGYARSHRSLHHDYAIIRQLLGSLPRFKLAVKAGQANPPVRDRTNAVNFLLENAEGTRRLFVSKGCRYLIRSLEQTRFADGRFEKEKVRDPKDARFVIDHPGDALDYYVANEHPFTRQMLCQVSYL